MSSVDIDQLQAVRDRERDREGLQELREDFYEEATAFVRELRAEREAAASETDDPFDDPRVTRLTDRIRTAEGTLEAIYEKRVGKLLTAATLAAADFPAEVEGMTREEAELFEVLVTEIESHREEVMGRLRGETGAGDVVSDLDAEPGEISDADDESADAPTEAVPSAPSDDEAGDVSGDISGDDDEPAPEPTDDADSEETAETVPDSTASAGDDADVDRTLVRITADVGSILGVDDTEYDLAEDDVVTLPTANAEPLLDRGAAERLE